MDYYHEQRSNEKKSASSSEGRRKKRPSLIPLRNSATRKSELCENNHPNDRMSFETEENNEACESRESGGGTVNWSAKSESEHNLRTPSEHHSIYSSPRTPRSSPKNFESDTPFIPFVHQSLTRTVWESDEIIPEEKEDIERKESQIEFNKQSNGNDFEVGNNIIEDQVREESLNENLFSENFTKSPQKIETYFNRGHNLEEKKENSFNKHLQISLPVITTIKPPTSFEQNSDGKLGPPFGDKKSNLVMEVTQEEYVSKAPIYYQQEMIACGEKSERDNNPHDGMIDRKRNWEKLSFSYLEIVSIRPVINEPENENKIGTKFQNFKIANPIFEHVACPKKNNVENRTDFSERLLAISKGYEEKIGFEREIGKPIFTESVDKETQTEQPEKQNDFNQQATKEGMKYLAYKNKELSVEGENNKENENIQSSGIIEEEIKYLKSFACQYDQNDIGIKPSIKRVSIADSKKNVIFNFDSNNSSTVTCEMEDKKNKNKVKETKSKPKDKVKPTKLQKEEPKAEAEHTEEKTRKSKRNLSRNEAKKARA